MSLLADEQNNVIDTDYERWRELRRMVIVYGLPRDESASESGKKTRITATATTVSAEGEHERKVPITLAEDAAADVHSQEVEDKERVEKEERGAACSLRGRIWKVFLGVNTTVNKELYTELVGRGASYCDGDIRNDTFRCVYGSRRYLCLQRPTLSETCIWRMDG